MTSTDDRSNNRPLYDRFLETLPEDGPSPPLIGKGFFLGKGFFHGKEPTSPGSSTHSKRSDESERDSLTPEQRRQSFLHKIYEPVDKVHGFDYDKRSLKMLLLNERSQDSFKLLGVVGMVGVGKTTLCRSLFEEDEVKQRFVPRIQITMSEETKSIEGVVKRCSKSIEGVVKEMLEHLGIEEDIINFISDCHDLPGLLYALHLQLKGKRYLILLDDVRDEDGYYGKLISCLRDGHGFPKWHGAAIIVTSRHEKAIKTMVGEQNLHRLLPLSDPESCWPIYQDAASLGKGISTPKEIKEELKKKCGGLPLAARIMGELKRQANNQESIESNNQESIESNKGSKEASTNIPEDGSSASQASAPKDGAINQAPRVSGDGFKEPPVASKDSVASDDGLDEATASKDGPTQASLVSGNGSNIETSTASKNGSSQASTAPNKSE